MRLSEFNPEFLVFNGDICYLAFDCPKCKKHRMEIPIRQAPKAWKSSGSNFEDFSLYPSVAHTTYDADDNSADGKSGRMCYSHFFVTNGNVTMCE